VGHRKAGVGVFSFCGCGASRGTSAAMSPMWSSEAVSGLTDAGYSSAYGWAAYQVCCQSLQLRAVHSCSRVRQCQGREAKKKKIYRGA
jgi:hypothetical protein